ncbi:5-formyltetrahydrofolate cyclo-ligase [Blattabacterium cuenoti]|uniref:5-formyltetrahydrofolate cyclo-ligase n=1 Tax=Blattabacterium cuenoti TaxID=1653831 RepID=UPI00163BC537|nr:5-formyltetrahydrofolate cyclo-ligase [Blattabacterium cuenoti]
MNKEKLRKKYFFYRKSISQEEVTKMSYKIFFQIKKILYLWEKKYYHIFLPIQKNKEVDTFMIIDFLLKKGKYIIVPSSNFHLISIENCFFNKNTSLFKNKHGILEPIYKHIVSISLIEVIFIPLLIFDLKGFRVGYGKGFYDRLIPLCRKNVIKIGLSFFPPVKEIINIHEKDLFLNIGVTTDRIFFFKKGSVKKNF